MLMRSKFLAAALPAIVALVAVPVSSAGAAKAAAAAPAAEPANLAAPVGADGQQPIAGTPGGPGAPTDTETVGDWVVRCFPVKGPAPCDMLQVSVAKDNQQQRILSLSFAYVPDRDGYGMQVIVPLGIAVQKGLSVGPATGPMGKLHYTRCENDGCYAEALVGGDTMTSLAAQGAKTSVSITPYGKDDTQAIVVSLNGFNDALAKLKVLAKQKATALPPQAPAPAGK